MAFGFKALLIGKHRLLMQLELAWMDGEWPLRITSKDQAVSNQGNSSVGTNAGMVFEQLMGKNKGYVHNALSGFSRESTGTPSESCGWDAIHQSASWAELLVAAVHHHTFSMPLLIFQAHAQLPVIFSAASDLIGANHTCAKARCSESPIRPYQRDREPDQNSEDQSLGLKAPFHAVSSPAMITFFSSSS
jgi:hypothetical protein